MVPCRAGIVAAHAALAVACSTVSPEVEHARDEAAAAGERFREPLERRQLPELRADASFDELQERALAVDPAIEAAWFAWAGGIERAVVAGALPQPEFGVGWTITEPPTSMLSNVLLAARLMLPAGAKLEAEQRAALAEAEVAQARFTSLWFARKGAFRTAWAAFDRAARESEIAARDVALADLLERSVVPRVAAGDARADEALATAAELARARDEELAARAELRAARAEVNALLSREPFAALDAPVPSEAPPLAATDEQLLELAVTRAPELRAAMAAVTARRRDVAVADAGGSSDLALDYRREETDNMLMLDFTLPLRRESIRAAIAAAEHAVREEQARVREVRNEAGAETAAQIVALREAERRLVLLRERLLPLARRAADALAGRLAAGGARFPEWIESQRALLGIELEVERARTGREAAIGRLLACCGAEPGGAP